MSETDAAAIDQGKRIAAAVADVAARLNCAYDDALELVAGVLTGLEPSIEKLGLAGRYVILDGADEVEVRLRAVEWKYGGFADARVKLRAVPGTVNRG